MKWHRAVAPATLAVAGFIACKEESISHVTIDLGNENAGTLGFACTEDRSASCAAILDCAVKPGPAQTTCFNELCRADGGGSRECNEVYECFRSKTGDPGECYGATCDRPRALIDRARDADGGADVHLLVDYVSLGGTPGCRVSQLRDWCRGGRCRPTRRSCVAVHLEPSALTDRASVAKAIADGFATKDLLDREAPDEPVLVRIIGTSATGPCTAAEEVPAPVPSERIVGCAYSCPVVLSASTGAVTVDFDVFGNQCTQSVLAECVDVFADAGSGL